MELMIPGQGTYNIENIVFDFNGTIAEGGEVRESVKNSIAALSEKFAVHIATADTFGTVGEMMKGLRVSVEIISRENEALDKKKIVDDLGAGKTIAIGNGFNDRHMLESAAIGFCIVGPEGASTASLIKSDAIIRSIEDFFLLLDEPGRLIATLRG